MKNQTPQEKIIKHLTGLFEMASPFDIIEKLTENLHARTEEMARAVKDSEDQKEMAKTMLEIEAVSYQTNMINLTIVGLYQEWEKLKKPA